MQTVLVTGAAGFIGSSLVDKLLSKNYNVIGLDNFNNNYDPNIKINNIQQAMFNKNYKLYIADIENKHDLDKIFSENKIDKIAHLAARAGVRASIEDAVSYMQTNIIGTVNILEMMKEYNIKHMSMASSSSVYGACIANKFSEDLNLKEPISPYAATKLADELICYTYHSLYNINIYMLRFFTVYGPRQRPELAINKFINQMLMNKPIDVYGDGSSMRDYTYIDDIIDGIIATLKYNKTKYEIFNLGSGNPISLNDMIKVLEESLNMKAIINRLPMQPGDVNKTFADISKAKKLLGYTPKTIFKDGIQKFINWKNKQC